MMLGFYALFLQGGVSQVSIDTRLSGMVLIMAVCCFVFPIFATTYLPLFDGMTVKAIEAMQAVMLLSFALYCYFYMNPLSLPQGQKLFWLWAIIWWIMLFGRSISWGRDYFPDLPKPYFRALSVCYIAPVFFMLLSKALRQEIMHKLKTMCIPAWAFVFTLGGLMMSEAIENERSISNLILFDVSYKNLIEELYEFPLILGLMFMCFSIMKQQKQGNESVESTSELLAKS